MKLPIKLETDKVQSDSTVEKYIVRYNGVVIGHVSRYEHNQWGANPSWDGLHLISDSRNRKTAVARLVEAYEKRDV